MTKSTPEGRLRRAEQEKALAEKRIRRATSDMKERDRRADTRRKILLGGVLLAQARTSETWARLLEKAIDHLPEKDRALFSKTGEAE